MNSMKLAERELVWKSLVNIPMLLSW